MKNELLRHESGLNFKEHKREYFFTYLSVALSNPTFAYYNIFHILFVLYCFYEFIRTGKQFDSTFLLIGAILGILVLGQTVVLNNFELESVIGLYLTFLLPYLIIRIVGERFWALFVNIIFVLAKISLLFWVLQNLSNEFSGLIATVSRTLQLDPASNESIIIYNMEHLRPNDLFGIMKNAGFTAEGGVYSGILCMAIFVNTLFTKQLFDRKNLVFYFSILTTTSTAGYAALFILLLGASIALGYKRYILIFFPILVYVIFTLTLDLPFLYKKVETYYQNELQVYESSPTAMRLGRFNSALQEMDNISQNPVFGRGIFKSDRYLSLEERDFGISGSLMGVVNILSKFGIPFYIYFMSVIFFSFLIFSRSSNLGYLYGIFGFLSLVAINIGQITFTTTYILVLFYSYKLINPKLITKYNLREDQWKSS